MTWTLHFDVLMHRQRDAIDVLERAEDADWSVTLSGEALLLDGFLLPEPG